jgi:4-hydroxybenzoate polyprenyltransferase
MMADGWPSAQQALQSVILSSATFPTLQMHGQAHMNLSAVSSCTWSICLQLKLGCFPDWYLFSFLGTGAILICGACYVTDDMWNACCNKKYSFGSSIPTSCNHLNVNQKNYQMTSVRLESNFNWRALHRWSTFRDFWVPSVCQPLYFSGIMWMLLYDTTYAHLYKIHDALIGL